MRVSASLGLVLIVASLVSCEQRNFDRCLPDNADYACEMGKFCKLIEGDPDGVGQCVVSECMAMPQGIPNGCTNPALPICTSAGRCAACTSSPQCAAINSAQPVCVIETGKSSGLCGQCGADTDCAGDPATPTPACEKSTRTCRACQYHSECASKVCAKDDTLKSLPNPIALGMCAPASRVLVVDDTCGTTCSLQTQVNAADAAKPYVLVKNYSGTNGPIVTISMKTDLPEQHLISGTADTSPALGNPPSAWFRTLLVNSGASVTVEGFMIKDNNTTGVGSVNCNSGTTPMPTSVKILRTTIASSDLAVKTSPMCKLTLDQSWIGTPPKNGGSGNFQAMQLDSTQFEIVNSVFHHNYDNAKFGGITLSGTSQGRIVNNTFYKQEGIQTVPTVVPSLAVYCPAAPQALIQFNNLFVNSTGSIKGKPYVDPNCYKAPNTLGYYGTDETPAPTGANIITGISDSVFVMASNGGLNLSTTEPTAKALISGGTKLFNNSPAPTVDILNLPRRSATVSIGAFEVSH